MELFNLPTSVDVTLYKYNYIDNQFWTRLRNECDYIDIDDDSFIIHTNYIHDLVEKYYKPLLRKINSVGSEFKHREVNSVYFIYMMLDEMPNVTYIKFTRSNSKKFSRLVQSEDEKMLRFDFKVLTATFKLPQFFSRKEVTILNKELEKAGVLKPGTPYSQHKLHDLMNTIDGIVINMEDSPAADLLTGFIDIIDIKLESDNPTVLLVTDY